MSVVLIVTDAHKTFRQTKALDGASMALNKGEWLALLGPNGAGKTTLIRAVAGRVMLDSGSVNLLGQSLNGDASRGTEARKKLGVVPQDLALYALLTARENMSVFGQMHGVNGSLLKERIDWAMQWTGLADRAKDLVKTYSGGMKRRLNIACGVLHRPEVVLLDEPTVGVDPQSRERIWEMLGQLRAGGASLLLTTHQLDEAQQICDRIVIIDHGKAIADGTLDQLVSKTIGRARKITLTLNKPVNEKVAARGTIENGGLTLTYTVNDVAAELPGLLSQIAAADAGVRVEDVQVQSPSLHSVFIHLTGRELRK